MVTCLVARNCLTLRAVYAGALSWCRIQVLDAHNSLLAPNFCHQPGQYLFVKMLVYCLIVWYIFMMDHALVVKEGDQHYLHLGLLHPGLLWSW